MFASEVAPKTSFIRIYLFGIRIICEFDTLYSSNMINVKYFYLLKRQLDSLILLKIYINITGCYNIIVADHATKRYLIQKQSLFVAFTASLLISLKIRYFFLNRF